MRWPPTDHPAFDAEDEDASWESLSGSRTYIDLRGFGIDDASQVIDVEGRWLAANTLNASDELQDALFDELANTIDCGVDSLDPGTASAVVALSAAGCVPLTSCNGEPGHQYARPTIVFLHRL